MEELVFDVRVWHTVLEVEYRFTVKTRSDQRARIGVREMFSPDQLGRRILRVWAGPMGTNPVTERATWEPL